MMKKIAMGNKKLDASALKGVLEKNRNEMKNKAVSFFKKNTLHFEVQLEDGNLEKVYFPFPP